MLCQTDFTPMILIPQRLFTDPNVRTLMRDGNNCILHKKLSTDLIGREAYVANHVVSIVLSGEQILRTYEETTIRVKAGEMVFLPRGVYYVTDLRAKGSTFQSVLFYFDEETIQQFLAGVTVGEINRTAAPESLRFPQTTAVSTFSDALLAVYGQQRSGKEFLRLKTLELLHLMNTTVGDRAFVEFLFRLTLPKKRNIKSFMEHNYDKPLKVEDYAYLTGRSLSSFRRDFRDYFGTTPNKWLRQQRLQQAIAMLDAGEMSVTELSYAVGYDNISYFIREFRKVTGLSPKQYMLARRNNDRPPADA